MDADGKETLSIICYQQQQELAYKTVRGFQGTYKLYDKIGDNGVLNKTLLKKTDWTVDYIDPSLDTRQRTFDTSEDSLLEFIFNAIDSYGSYVPLFNTVNKTISIYLEQNYGTDDGLLITYGKYLKSLKETDSFDKVVTRLTAIGDDDLTLNSILPTGRGDIEDYSFYMNGYEEDEEGNVISSSRYMSDELCHALLTYDKLLEEKSDDFSSLQSQKAAQQAILITKQNDLFNLNNQMELLLDEKDSLLDTNGDLTNVNGRIASKQVEIDAKNVEIATVNTAISGINTQISDLRVLISVENNFTYEQLVEKEHFSKEKTWTDTNYTDVNELYEQAKENLKLWSQPSVAYNCDIIDIMAALNVPYDKSYLRIGSIITIHYPRFNIDIKAKIITMTHDIDGNDLSLVVANSRDIKSGFIKIKDLLNRSASTSTTIDMNKAKWDQSDSNTNAIKEILNSKWDANKQAIEGGSEQQWSLDARGLTLRSPSDVMNLLRAVNSVLAISNDGGKSIASLD